MNNDIIKQIKANKQANSFIKTNKLKDEDILKNLSAFTQFIDQESICANCDGKKCSSIIEGLKCELSYSNKVNVEYYDCPIYNETTDNNEFEVIDYTEKQVEIYDTPARLQLYNVFSNVRENLKSDNQNKKGIYLHGNYGTGKSLLMYEFAKRLSKKYKVIFAYYPDLVRRIQLLFGYNMEIEELIVRLKKCDILFLDDIGRENNTGFIRDSILGPILQYRCDNNLPVFFTSNRSIKELANHLAYANGVTDVLKGNAIASRIKFLSNEYELVDKDFRNI